ncbi:Qat anti-phage system TatD family nuclease QatD [Mesorhizobium captivum]|uniref:Qat anti-phage system TatD family nuclease QatD n=1 Tax=Mesorhizobium captivum TaxID=3072319 RepID=UPI002A24A6C1|nr:Qat anti-phage system TatD family nuclease QatD [Mesorhizobium sp. VK22E]MDX8508621.1 Qat anti-phage system TatD family nuclease QatD [Mesorhizobium sp. VK22E]
MIDFHCHIDLFKDPNPILDEAEKKGVYLLAVTTTPKAWTGTKRLIGNRRRVRIALGLHPELVRERHTEIALFEHYLSETGYVGEVGLDGSPHLSDSFELQIKTLRRILLACSKVGGRVISLHSRRAASKVLDLLEAEPAAGTPILHWFSGSTRELERAIQIGCWFSVGPSMMGSAKGRKLVELMPRERILTETDSPFAQIDGRPLSPWDVRLAYPAIGDIWSCSESDVETQLLSNLRSLAAGVRGR